MAHSVGVARAPRQPGIQCSPHQTKSEVKRLTFSLHEINGRGVVAHAHPGEGRDSDSNVTLSWPTDDLPDGFIEKCGRSLLITDKEADKSTEEVGGEPEPGFDPITTNIIVGEPS